MGTKVFTGTQGTVVIVEPPANQAQVPFTLKLDNVGLGPEQIRGMVTSVTISQDTNVQFMHSLRDTIYVNVFGNKIGQMTISGIIFLGNVCPTEKGSASPLDDLYNYYMQNNVVGRPTAIPVALGKNLTFKAFILGFQSQILDPQSYLGQFSMSMALVPKVNVSVPGAPGVAVQGSSTQGAVDLAAVAREEARLWLEQQAEARRTAAASSTQTGASGGRPIALGF